MKTRIVCYTIAGLLLGVNPHLTSQEIPEDCPVDSSNAKKTPVTEEKKSFWKNASLTGGQLTLPFKVRPKADAKAFRLTTDVTLGGYVGINYALSSENSRSITFPLTAGLTFINVSNNNTSLDRSADEPGVLPGITWSTGIILQWDQFNLGLMLGKDYVSEIGDDWMYNGKLWWSFGIGFAFINQ